MITLQNMIFANPQAYQVFPNMVNPYNTGTTELARYTGYLIITDNNGNTHSFTNTSAIDFTTISGLVTIDNVTDRGSVRLGRWQIAQSIIITNDITITVTPIAEVSSDGATITPQYEVKHNTYHNGELTESIVITPDNVTLQSNVEWITISNNQIVVAANTNTEARQGQVTIQVQFQEYSTTANYDIVQAGYDIEQDIMQSMVLWYDIAKQGATNESMATTPTLIDHSGNGHNATCYNFAWSGMSGVGGYEVSNFIEKDTSIMPEKGEVISSNLLRINKLNPGGSGIGYWNVGTLTFNIKLRVGGLTNDQTLYMCQYNSNQYNKQQLYNGINELSFDFSTNPKPVNGNYTYATFVSDTTTDCDITVELLPQYPNALVSDGVDDYCLVEGLPLLNKEDGYTVIAKRKWLSEVNVKDLIHPFISKNNDSTVNNLGAFLFEAVLKDKNSSKAIANFGSINTLDSFSQEDISYQTSKYYNGTIITAGNQPDVQKIRMFCLSASEGFTQIALYSFLLFNRDLSTDEIEWVKTNLIESEQ